MHSSGTAAASAVKEAESESILRHILLDRGHITIILAVPFQQLPRAAAVGSPPSYYCCTNCSMVWPVRLSLSCWCLIRLVAHVVAGMNHGACHLYGKSLTRVSVERFCLPKHRWCFIVFITTWCHGDDFASLGRPSKTLSSLCRQPVETPSTYGQEIGGKVVAALTRQRKAHQPATQTQGSSTWICSTGRRWSSRRILSQAWNCHSS